MCLVLMLTIIQRLLRACYTPNGHAVRLAGMPCASRACHASRGHAMRLTGMPGASWSCYAPRGHVMLLAGILYVSHSMLCASRACRAPRFCNRAKLIVKHFNTSVVQHFHPIKITTTWYALPSEVVSSRTVKEN